MTNADKEALLHILRNPFNWSEETVREVRAKAADELERLWNMEQQAGRQVRQLSHWFEKEKP